MFIDSEIDLGLVSKELGAMELEVILLLLLFRTESDMKQVANLCYFAVVGRLKPGDLILAVNGQSMAQVTNER